MPEGITPQHYAVVFNSMSHVGTHAQQSSLWIAFLGTKIPTSIECQKIKQDSFFADAAQSSITRLVNKEQFLLGAGAELIALELEVEATSGQAKFTSSARNVAAVFAQGV